MLDLATNCYNKDKTDFKSNTIENITLQVELDQLINEPTHILETSSSCIDLVFTSQINLAMESVVHYSLHSSCHHQVVFAKFTLKIYYPPPYSREVLHFKETETDLIRTALNEFIWERAFSNANVNKKVCIFNKSLLNVLSNFIPHKTISRNDKDPPWVTLGLSFIYRTKIKCSKIIERTKPILNCLMK